MTTTNALAGHQYDALFYRYQREGSLRSADVVLPLVFGVLPVGSVLDIGCGAGAWLSVAHGVGTVDVWGVDGDYVDRSLLLINPARFIPRDISQSFDNARGYDLVMCLEVAEHVPNACSVTLVDNIVRHAKMVLFSAAVPGQGGEDHINEQPYEFWRDLFAARGYRLFDCVRPGVSGNPAVEPWYRYNLLLFVQDDLVRSLPAAVAATRVADRQPVRDFSPPAYRARKWLLKRLPDAVVTRLAVWKHRRFVRSLQRQA